MSKERIEQYIDYSVFLYIFLFMLYGFVARIIPLYMNIDEQINSLVFVFFAGSGCLLVFLDLIRDQHLFKGKYCWVLYAFIAVMILSSLINIQYGYSDNIKTIIWTGIQVALYYSAYTRVDSEKMLKFLCFIFHMISWIWTIAVIYSLKQFVIMIGYSVEIWPGEWRYQGFSVNRLFGIFNDPNYAGVTSVYVIIMLLFLFKNSKRKWLKAVCVFASFFHIVYIILSGSRTAKVCSIIVSFILIFFLIRNQFQENKVLKKNVLSCLCACLAVCFIVGIGLGLREGLPYIPKWYAGVVLDGQTKSGDKGEESEQSIEEVIAESVSKTEADSFLQRGDVERSTHTRQKIWENYIRGLKGRYIIGASPRNIDKYIEDVHPDIYIQNEGYETHSGFLSVFAGTGFIGVIVVVVYMILILRKLIIYCFGNTNIDDNFIMIFSIVMCILIYTCFFTELFFVNNLTTAIFWILLGTIMYWLDGFKREKVV